MVVVVSTGGDYRFYVGHGLIHSGRAFQIVGCMVFVVFS